MEKTKKLVKPLLVVGGVVTSYFIYKRYKTKKDGPNGKQIKKWINWEIEFNKDASEEDKAGAVKKVEKHVLDHCHSQFDNSGITLKNINFAKVVAPLKKDRVAFTGIADFSVFAKDAFRTPPPPPPPPPANIFAGSIINNIREFDVNPGQ